MGNQNIQKYIMRVSLNLYWSQVTETQSFHTQYMLSQSPFPLKLVHYHRTICSWFHITREQMRTNKSITTDTKFTIIIPNKEDRVAKQLLYGQLGYPPSSGPDKKLADHQMRL